MNPNTPTPPASPPPRILVAGIGNIFFGDDAFGVEVAQRLVQLPHPPNVRIVDFGIRGLDLTYALLDGVDFAILIDAAPRGKQPGTLYIIQPDPPQNLNPAAANIDPHSLEPEKVLAAVAAMGGKIENLIVVGCEPTPVDLEEMQMSITPPVLAAIENAIPLVQSLIIKIMENPGHSLTHLLGGIHHDEPGIHSDPGRSPSGHSLV